MKASTRFETKHAFVLDESDLRKLWMMLQKFTPNLQAKIKCSDGLSRVPNDIDETASYENPKRAALLSIELSGMCDNREDRLDVVISGEHSNSISFNLRGDEQVISPLRTEIIDFFDGLRPWYSKFATFDLIFIWAPLFLGIFLVSRAVFPPSTPADVLTVRQELLVTVLVFAVGSLLILMVSFFGKIKKLCFPVATFAIGQGLKRHAVGESLRWTVIVGFVVSIIASCVFALQPWIK